MRDEKNKPSNPNAFPCVDGPHYLQEGMTLRDYFAAKALSIIPFVAKEFYQNPNTWDEKSIANEAYEIADAMLKQREL